MVSKLVGSRSPLHLAISRRAAQLRAASLLPILAMVFAAALPACAETGMGLVTTGTSFSDLRVGNIVRIDVDNNVIKPPTASLGYGVSPRFSPDGKRICYLKNGSNTVTIINIDGGFIREFSVDALPGDGGTLSWTTSGIWVGCDGKIVRYDSLSSGTGTKLSTYTTAGSERRGMVSLNEITGGGVYIGGTWRPRVYQMRSHTNVSPNMSTDGCSVCPSPNGLRLTNNIYESPTGNGVHRTMRIIDTLGNLVRYLNIQDITKFSASDYHMDMQSWSSNSNDWILIPAGQGGSTPSDNCSPCIYNTSTSQKICLKDNSGTNNHWQPFDYYSGWIPSATGPSLQVSSTSLSFSADSGAASPPTQNVTASTPNGSLTGITVTGAPSWLTAAPNATSGASVPIVNTVTTTRLTPGTYRDTLTVAAGAAGSQTYTVVYTVRRPAVVQVLDTVKISPRRYTVVAGGTIKFVATCKDRNGRYFTGASLGWTTDGGGTISNAGAFTAVATPVHGPHTIVVTASAGGVTLRDTALVIVSRKNGVHRRIDAGTNSYLPTGWETDDASRVGTTGTDWDNPATISVTGIPGAAPANVYKSVRRGNPHEYLVSGLAAGAYTVRMHFVDAVDSARLMSYTILGQNVLCDFSISTLAGGINRPLVLDFPAYAQNANGIPIVCGGTGDVLEAGMEVIQNDLKVVTLLSPLGGERFAQGQTMQIRWVCDTVTLRQIYIKLSVNNGLAYGNFTGNYGVKVGDSGVVWGTYNWTIPDSFALENNAGKRSTASARCRITVVPYSNLIGGFDVSDSMFTIDSRATVTSGAHGGALGNGLRYVASGRGLTISAWSAGAYRIEVFSLAGKLLYAKAGNGTSAFVVPRAASAGAAVIRMQTRTGVLQERAVFTGRQ